MTEPLLPADPSAHAAHDLTLIAALAARVPDLRPGELVEARRLVATCAACTDILADVVALAAATPHAAIPSRPRDFTLSSADAARLRPLGWRRVLGFIGSARDGVTRPLALGLTTVGLAGLLVATLPSALGGSGASQSLSTVGNAVGGEAAPAAASDGPERLGLGPDESGVSAQGEGGLFSGAGDSATDGQRDSGNEALDASIRTDRSGLSIVAILAGVLLIVGLGLFGLRWTARRLGDG